MKYLHIILSIALTFTSTAFAAEPKQSVIEGKIVKMVPSAKEIYVQAEGKKYEFYFNKDTKVQHDGQEAQYESLSEGQSVKVTAHKIGKRLDPVTVEVIK